MIIFCFSEILFVDPTAEEENLATGQLTIVTIQDKLCMVHKPGAYRYRPFSSSFLLYLPGKIKIILFKIHSFMNLCRVSYLIL